MDTEKNPDAVGPTPDHDLLDTAVLRLTLAPFQHHSLVRQEHGRTIPLAAISAAAAEFDLIEANRGSASTRNQHMATAPA
jgi:hypothetical protein